MDYIERLKTDCRTQSGPYLRPFAPNPQWASAKVFIIGQNPATPFRDEFVTFEHYWAGLTVNPESFDRVYRNLHRGRASKTSQAVRDLIESLDPVNALVTNVSWYPAGRFKNVPRTEQKRSDRLQGLIAHCRPKVLFAHGRAARNFVNDWYGVDLNPDCPPRQQATVVSGMLCLAYHHFTGQGLPRGSRFQPAVAIPAFADRIRQHLGQNAD